jgi:outer membrane receptor protein involved in Fe transport
MSSARIAKLISISTTALIAGTVSSQAAGQTASNEAASNADIVVTAQRREESLSKVPASIVALSQEQMDIQGVRGIDDVVRLTPGLRITPANGANGGRRSNISIRGIASSVGSPTTGVYLNDTPIQVRPTGNVASNFYPYVFDLERVEVLRGPQGTLFGAGAEGGVVRFITRKPSLTKSDIYGRADFGMTEGGDPSYEAGAALGGPLLNDVLGFRVSGSYRNAGGWVDRVDPVTTKVVKKNGNNNANYTLRGALKWQVTPDLTVEPSLFYQHQSSDDRDLYFANLSDPDKGVFRSGKNIAQPFKDKFLLPALDVRLNAGTVTFVSSTSYIDRTTRQRGDFSNIESALFFGTSIPPYSPFIDVADYADKQKSWTQEFRIESSNPGSPLKWTIGAFYGDNDQSSLQANTAPTLDAAFRQVLGLTAQQFFGVPLYQGAYTFYATRTSSDEQKALFGQADYEVANGFTLTAGVRQAWTKFAFHRTAVGPAAGAATPVTVNGNQKESPFTYKVGASWQVDADNLLYTSVSKGFRTGGANPPSSSFCQASLAQLGITDAPSAYDSDSTTSYEVGSKNKTLGGALQVAASAFYVNWKNIQQSVPLQGCGSEFIANFGNATAKGFDLELTARPTPALTLGASLGYTDATLDKTLRGTGTIILGLKGDPVTSGPKWTAALSGNYEFEIAGRTAFIRTDYQYQGKGQLRTPTVFGVDAQAREAEVIHALSFRAGVDLGSVNVSAYVNNALDQAPRLSRVRDLPSTTLFYETSVRPRTFGLTLTYQH